jgi:hypothetical protein
MFVLDTNVVSELRKTTKGNPGVLAWAKQQKQDQLFVSVMTIMEIEAGILLMERKDRGQGAVLRGWFDNTVLPGFTNRILPVDTAVARYCAQLQVPQPKPVHDAMIAATALVHGMTVVTRNVPDFQGTGVAIMNPFT